MIDYRLKQNRKEAFIDWYGWSLKHKDCDPAIWLTNYLFDRFEHNLEQKYWIAWIYGTTYHLPTTWIIWNEFPDFDLVDYNRLEQWNNLNYKRLRYQTDTKYNKGFLPRQFLSYKNWIMHNNPEKTQDYKFKKLTENNAFENVWFAITKNLYKFGRYSTWFYMQTLNDCVNVKLLPKDLKLLDYSGSRSHRNGLLYALGKEEWIDKVLPKDVILYLEQEAKELQQSVEKKYNVITNPYTMETCLCSFKKIFRVSKGRYLGYYLDRQAEEINQVENDNWHGIDWKVFWEAREETLNPRLAQSKNIDKSKFANFLNTGNFLVNL